MIICDDYESIRQSVHVMMIWKNDNILNDNEQLRIHCGKADKSYFHALSIQYFVLNRYSINKLSRSPAFLTTCNYKISYSKGACDVFKSPAFHLRGCDARPPKDRKAHLGASLAPSLFPLLLPQTSIIVMTRGWAESDYRIPWLGRLSVLAQMRSNVGAAGWQATL